MPAASHGSSVAETYGTTVILGVGVALALAAIAAVFTGHQWVAGGLAASGVLACVASILVDRMEGEFSLLGFHGRLCVRHHPADARNPPLASSIAEDDASVIESAASGADESPRLPA